MARGVVDLVTQFFFHIPADLANVMLMFLPQRFDLASWNVMAAWNDTCWTRLHRRVLGVVQKHHVASDLIPSQSIDRVVGVIVAIFVQWLCAIWVGIEVVVVTMEVKVVVGSKD